MFERLVLCEFVVADLTAANANVFYELGVRHAARPHSTVQIFAGRSRLPFDVAMLRALPYELDADGRPANVPSTRESLAGLLRLARESGATDSPLFQLLEDYPDVQREKTDIFRARVKYAGELKQRLATARGEGRDAVAAVEQELVELAEQDTGVLVDLLLSYRAVNAWEEMIRLTDRMPQPVAETVLVQEQLAFALNRDDRGSEAEQVLLRLLDRKGPSSETLGLLGRVYKDRWEAATREGNGILARGFLRKAIDAYRRGFEADWRDAYPGVNAVTLMEIRDPGGAAQQQLLPTVRYANRRRLDGRGADYWDHATRLELGVVGRDRDEAIAGARAALAAVRERWEPESTAYNLSLIRESRAAHGETVDWADELERELLKAAEWTAQ
jgi:hypothetical protein